MGDIRPIDWWMLVIESGILLLMISGILWGVPAWLEKRKEEKALQQRLASLSAPVAQALSKMVLEGIQLSNNETSQLTQFPTPLIEHDYTMGWRVWPEYKKSVEKWALQRSRGQ